ncbi:hypothetical protein GG804_24975 [Sphingomonas histidinilytica]|uniref:hypothetical protein n=1 Tax=Rhizorhabdus histidinilytica TaxID=439228 RepID=UPI001ADB42E3|nr:hypothetical protein [Rhizorhabdus histidinilytica]MBO9380025.1 hypothetical protein [Rhizorhabdus histidinilytica]
MTDRLSLYNGALRLCEERRLASLTENREPRRLLDDAWGDGSTSGAVKHCLELGQWTFATRTGRVDYDPGIAPSFGYRYAFPKPDDFVRACAVCADEFFEDPLLQYRDERTVWFASIPTIYASWVSNGATYGADMSLWPESFAKLVEAYLANEIVRTLTQDGKVRDKVEADLVRAKASAESLDAQNRPTALMPVGGWVRARHGRSNYRRSRWSGEYRG